MKTFWVCLIIIGVAFGFGWSRHHQIVELRRQNAELRVSADEILRYKSESAELDRTAVDTNELKQFRAERLELMNLRSEIGRLRQAAKVELPKIKQEVESTVAQTAQVQQRASDLRAERAAKQSSRLTAGHLSSLVDCLRIVARANGGRFPGSFAEAEAMSSAVPRKIEREHVRHIFSWTNHSRPTETELTGISFSVSARSFEFMPFDRLLNTKDPPLPFLREITPRQLPNGCFARYYGFTDGRVEEAIPRDGNFSDWEREQSRGEGTRR